MWPTKKNCIIVTIHHCLSTELRLETLYSVLYARWYRLSFMRTRIRRWTRPQVLERNSSLFPPSIRLVIRQRQIHPPPSAIPYSLCLLNRIEQEVLEVSNRTGNNILAPEQRNQPHFYFRFFKYDLISSTQFLSFRINEMWVSNRASINFLLSIFSPLILGSGGRQEGYR